MVVELRAWMSRAYAALFVAAVAFAPTDATGAADPEPDTDRANPQNRPVGFGGDCRYDATANTPDGSFEDQFLPSDGLFRPPVADMKEPRFSAAVREVSFDPGILARQRSGENFTAGVTSFGSTFGLYSARDGRCNGIQVGMMAGVFSQFNLDTQSLNLINSDFIVGFPVTFRSGRFSGRLRVFHQSSHLGDEFILENENVDRLNLSYEAIDVLASYAGDWWRLYGGGGYLFQRDIVADPIKLQGGAEFRSSTWWSPEIASGRELQALGGVDVKSFQERDWGVTVSAKAGLEAATGERVSRRLRFMFVFLRGFIPFGQFFNNEELTNVGGELQYEF